MFYEGIDFFEWDKKDREKEGSNLYFKFRYFFDDFFDLCEEYSS